MKILERTSRPFVEPARVGEHADARSARALDHQSDRLTRIVGNVEGFDHEASDLLTLVLPQLTDGDATQRSAASRSGSCEDVDPVPPRDPFRAATVIRVLVRQNDRVDASQLNAATPAASLQLSTREATVDEKAFAMAFDEDGVALAP